VYYVGEDRAPIALRLGQGLLDEIDSRTRAGNNRSERIRSLLARGLDCDKGLCWARVELDRVTRQVSHPSNLTTSATQVGDDPWSGDDPWARDE
jgi:hypothetical protein